MKLLDSLLDAIVRLEGDALVMHVGEKPYVVTASSSMNAYRGPLAWGQVELSSRVLTFDAVSSMLGQILPADQQQALTEFGAIEHEIPSPAGVADRFTVVAARGGEDVWVELRRRPIEAAAAAPVAEPVPAPAAPPAHIAESIVAQPASPAEPLAPPPVPEAVVAPADEQPAVDAAAVEGLPPVAETREPAAELEIQGIEIVTDADDADQPAADIELDANSSIVVAIPGQHAEEIALNAVPDNAIQIVDDEPQGVPTEEEVDAMLAATAGVILSSGLGEVVDDGVAADAPEAQAAQDADGDEEEIVLEVEIAASTSDVSPSAPAVEESAPEVAAGAVPEFELSPPPVEMPVGAPAAEPDVVAETPVGTPLFSEEAVLAAAAPEVFVEPPVDAVLSQPEAPAWTPPPPEAWAPQLPAHFEPASFEPAVPSPVEQAPHVELPTQFEQPTPFEVPAQIEQPPQFQPAAQLEPPAHPVAEPAPTEAFVEPPVDAVLSQPEAPMWTPAQPEAWAPQLPAHVEPTSFEPAVPSPVEQATHVEVPTQFEQPTPFEVAAQVEQPSQFQPAAQLEPPAHPVAQTAAYEAFVEPPVDAVLSQPEAPMWTPAQPEAWTPQLPAHFEPATPFEPAAQWHEEQPAQVEQPAAWQPPAPEQPTAPASWTEAPSSPAIDELPGEMPVVTDDANTMSQGAEPTASEPMPQIEAPSVPEMTMEVTPELQQQGAPMAHMAGEAAASIEATSHAAHEAAMHAESAARTEDEARQAVVVPLARSPIKPEVVAVPFTPSEDAALMHTLRVAAARGASTVYVVAQSKPMIRIDGEIGPLESEPTLTAADVDRLVMELAPPRRREAFQNGPVEWLCDVPEIGRVRCLTFRDHRGPGVLFRMFPPRAISADQLGLTPEVQSLCQQSDGLVLVTGARASGKSTLLNSFVDVINRTRSDHLITIESQIGFVHESRRSFISQRETRGDADLAATYARAALREDPDVIMIEDLKSADLVSAALEAAESGRLVLASVPAASTIGALERLIDVFPADRRAKVRTTLATALRGVIAQVLLRRVKGGRVAAREILLNTPAVSQIVLEGKMFQLPVALDSGRRHGMVPLTDSLAAHVREGTVNVAEAYRKALDRAALVALLKREGLDTSFAERLA